MKLGNEVGTPPLPNGLCLIHLISEPVTKAELRIFSVKPPGAAQTPMNTRALPPSFIPAMSSTHKTQAGKQRTLLLLTAVPRAELALCAPHPLPGRKMS